MTSTPIACELYDYIEIACTFRYPVLFLLNTGEEIRGIALDTSVKPDKTEYLIIKKHDSNEKTEIALSNLIKMEALVDNPYFKKVNFVPE